MNTHAVASFGLALILCIAQTSTLAQSSSHRTHGAPPPQQHFDHRFNHDRYYPPHGAVVRELPHGYYGTYHRGAPYYFHGGTWYRPYRSRFVIVAPPIGAIVPVLPAFYTTIWVRGAPYYYADDVYYIWDPARSGYVVTGPPADAEEAATTISNDEWFIYPKQGQSSEQQATDRYECHRWAADQTGFDPTQSLGGASQSVTAAKRADYRRAQATCLEGRGYSVK